MTTHQCAEPATCHYGAAECGMGISTTIWLDPKSNIDTKGTQR